MRTICIEKVETTVTGTTMNHRYYYDTFEAKFTKHLVHTNGPEWCEMPSPPTPGCFSTIFDTIESLILHDVAAQEDGYNANSTLKDLMKENPQWVFHEFDWRGNEPDENIVVNIQAAHNKCDTHEHISLYVGESGQNVLYNKRFTEEDICDCPLQSLKQIFEGN